MRSPFAKGLWEDSGGQRRGGNWVAMAFVGLQGVRRRPFGGGSLAKGLRVQRRRSQKVEWSGRGRGSEERGEHVRGGGGGGDKGAGVRLVAAWLLIARGDGEGGRLAQGAVLAIGRNREWRGGAGLPECGSDWVGRSPEGWWRRAWGGAALEAIGESRRWGRGRGLPARVGAVALCGERVGRPAGWVRGGAAGAALEPSGRQVRGRGGAQGSRAWGGAPEADPEGRREPLSRGRESLRPGSRGQPGAPSSPRARELCGGEAACRF